MKEDFKTLPKAVLVGFILAIFITPVFWGFALLVLGGHGSTSLYERCYIVTAILTSGYVWGKEIDNVKAAKG